MAAGEADRTEAIARHIESRRGTPGHQERGAALRKWSLMRFGADIGRPRVRPSDVATSPQTGAEVRRLRERLESDGPGAAVVGATCSATATFLGWRFPDGAVAPSAVAGSDVTSYLREAKPHLKPGAAKVEANRIGRYLRLLSEEDPARPDEPSYAPSCWGSPSLPRAVTDDELRAILSAGTCGDAASRNRAAILPVCNMGLRCCEVAALTLDDVDFRNGEVVVRASKGQDARRLPPGAETGAALADYLMRHRPATGGSRAVFLRHKSHRGEPMTVSQLRGSLRYQASAAGVTDFGTHMLRRRAATDMVSAGTPLKVVADMLGHAEARTANTYLRMDLEGLRAVCADWPGGRRG